MSSNPNMKKLFVDPITVRNNAIKMAYQMWCDNFIPSMIYVPLRGGAILGNVMSEVFKILYPDNPPMYCAVMAHSYTGYDSESEVCIDGWTTNPEEVRSVDRVLMVDDIFDTGQSANFLWKKLLGPRKKIHNFRLAVHDYKEFTYREKLPKIPDYYASHYILNKPEEDFWIHYNSHELYGLSIEEREEHYCKVDPELRDIFDIIFAKKRNQYS